MAKVNGALGRRLPRTGTISRFAVETTGLRVPVGMHKALREYEQYARERRHLRPTSLAERMHNIAVFLDFLRVRGLESLDMLQAEHLSAFVQTRTDWKPRTVACVSSSVRLFLQYLFMRGILPRDLSFAVPTVRLASSAKIPSVWEPELVERLLTAVDRSSPKGRRDYAILLLAARLGLRLGDIKVLALDHLHWSTSTIEIVQSKTGEPLVLPLIEEVGAALIDYLRAGRPPVDHRHLFTNLTPPFDPICQRITLSSPLETGQCQLAVGHRARPRAAQRNALATQHNLAGRGATANRSPACIGHPLGPHKATRSASISAASTFWPASMHRPRKACRTSPSTPCTGKEICTSAAGNARSAGFVRDFFSVVPFFAC